MKLLRPRYLKLIEPNTTPSHTAPPPKKKGPNQALSRAMELHEKQDGLLGVRGDP